MASTQQQLAARLAARISQTYAAKGRRPIIIGLCGPQGAGKSTLAGTVARILDAAGLRSVVMSIDDVYLTRTERRRLALEIHPLLAVRGPPGTHDVPLAQAVLDAIVRGETVRMPRFDKAHDDRCDPQDQPVITGPTDVILFEGWCVGARPQDPVALQAPVNRLERDQDPDGIWRTYVNQALAGAYQALFARLDLYVLLQAPSFGVVVGWRQQQEQALRERAGASSLGMTDAEVADFVQHFERLSRHIAQEAPLRADVVVSLDATRQPIKIEGA